MTDINIAIVADHHLFRRGMVRPVKSLNSSLVVMLEAENGKTFLEQLVSNVIQYSVLLDISMPIMDGFKTAKVLYERYPDLKILIGSLNEDESSLIKMLQYGLKGFVGKDIELEALKIGISKVFLGGFYYSEKMAEHLIKTLQPKEQKSSIDTLSERKMERLVIACSERTYKNIA